MRVPCLARMIESRFRRFLLSHFDFVSFSEPGWATRPWILRLLDENWQPVYDLQIMTRFTYGFSFFRYWFWSVAAGEGLVGDPT